MPPMPAITGPTSGHVPAESSLLSDKSHRQHGSWTISAPRVSRFLDRLHCWTFGVRPGRSACRPSRREYCDFALTKASCKIYFLRRPWPATAPAENRETRVAAGETFAGFGRQVIAIPRSSDRSTPRPPFGCLIWAALGSGRGRLARLIKLLSLKTTSRAVAERSFSRKPMPRLALSPAGPVITVYKGRKAGLCRQGARDAKRSECAAPRLGSRRHNSAPFAP